jgi:coenzyme PQQ precursor peptide PqqA
MDWEAPSFVEIRMDAELTSYVTEDDDAPIAREE